MENANPFDLAKALHAQVTSLVRAFDVYELPATERTLLTRIVRQAADIRLDVREYGMAETKAAQDRTADEVRSRLKQLEAAIMQAGGAGLFGPADVAHLSAVIQQLMSEL